MTLSASAVRHKVFISYHHANDHHYKEELLRIFEDRYPLLPSRIIDNLLTQKAKISVTPWQRIQQTPEYLKWLIAATHADKERAEYDLSRPMRRADS